MKNEKRKPHLCCPGWNVAFCGQILTDNDVAYDTVSYDPSQEWCEGCVKSAENPQ